jgi:hypothetical protein
MLPRYYSRDSTLHPKEHKTAGSVHAPERSSCIGDSGVWAPRHWSIVAEGSKMGSSKPPTRSVRSRPRSRHFPVGLPYLATEVGPSSKGKKIDLLIHTSLKISCTRVMARTTRYQRHIDNSTKHRQLYFEVVIVRDAAVGDAEREITNWLGRHGHE